MTVIFTDKDGKHYVKDTDRIEINGSWYCKSDGEKGIWILKESE